MIRAVLDVNVHVAALIGSTGGAHKAVRAWHQQRFELVTSDHIRYQTVQKLYLPRIRRRYPVPDNVIRIYDALTKSYATNVVVSPADVHAVIDDEEDNWVLATGRLEHADYLVTRDKKVLALRSYAGMKIVSPHQFISLLEKSVDV